MGLILHCGAEVVDYPQLLTLAMPEATETHVPIAHHKVVDIVKNMLAFYGHTVTREDHAITKDGARYFGMLSLQSDYGDYDDTVIMRNSHDKKFPIGIGFGSRTFVCDNLAFIADQVVKRKHTAKANHALPSLISEIVEPLAQQRQQQFLTFARYKATPIKPQLAHHAILQMFKDEVINVTRIPDVLEQWERPACDWGEQTAYRLFNAATYTLAGRVAENPQATTRLHRFVNDVCEMA